MVARFKPHGSGGKTPAATPPGNYFAEPKRKLKFIPSGSTLLDCALGGGWAESRIANVVGDKSTGKTLVCIEASAQFIKKYPKAKVFYREAEAAFDPEYAQELGMPLKSVDFGESLETVDDMFEDIQGILSARTKTPFLYIVDSLDALSDRAEMERDIDQGTYGGDKAKKMSQLFRRTTRRIEQSSGTMMIVSQVRDKIGAMVGKKTTRSGGRALDFYASQVAYLSHIGRIVKTSHGIKRPVGIAIKAMIEKNKISLPFRTAEFNILFGYGIDDFLSSLNWLKETGFIADAKMPKDVKGKLAAWSNEVWGMEDDDFAKEIDLVKSAVVARWPEVETSFLPKRRKYA